MSFPFHFQRLGGKTDAVYLDRCTTAAEIPSNTVYLEFIRSLSLSLSPGKFDELVRESAKGALWRGCTRCVRHPTRIDRFDCCANPRTPPTLNPRRFHRLISLPSPSLSAPALFSNNEIFHAKGYFTLYARRGGGEASKTRRLIKIGQRAFDRPNLSSNIFYRRFSAEYSTISRSDMHRQSPALLLATLSSKRDRSSHVNYIPTLYFIPEIK